MAPAFLGLHTTNLRQDRVQDHISYACEDLPARWGRSRPLAPAV